MSDNDSERPVRLVIADDSLLVREGIAKVLTAQGFEIVAEAADGDELLRKLANHHADTAIVDIRMPPTATDEGLRAAELIGQRHPGVAVLVLSDYLEPAYAIRLLDAGAPGRGYLLKDTVTEREAFASAIRRVTAGECVVDPAIITRLFRRLRTNDPLALLSGRERETLALMAEGRSNRAIAEHFVVSERTIETHVGHIFQKLGLENTPDDHRRVLAVLAYVRA